MMPAIESTAIFDSKAIPNCSRYAQCTSAPRKVNAYAAAVVAKLREFAPYAVIELVLPGGSLMALLLWFYRRQKKAKEFPPALDTLV